MPETVDCVSPATMNPAAAGLMDGVAPVAGSTAVGPGPQGVGRTSRHMKKHGKDHSHETGYYGTRTLKDCIHTSFANERVDETLICRLLS